MGDFFDFTPVGMDGNTGYQVGNPMHDWMQGGVPYVTSTTTDRTFNDNGTTVYVVTDNYINGSADVTVVVTDMFEINFYVQHYDNIVDGHNVRTNDYSDLWI